MSNRTDSLAILLMTVPISEIFLLYLGSLSILSPPFSVLVFYVMASIIYYFFVQDRNMSSKADAPVLLCSPGDRSAA